MIKNKGNLKPAHSGYRYQDIATAHFLIQSILGKCGSVTVDKKQVEDDRLDDLEVTISDKVFRKQIKSSPDASRTIKRLDFTGSQSTLRIDRLVLTHVRSPYAVEEYRLSATWQSPNASDELSNFIKAVDAEPTFEGTSVSFFKLRPEKIWPVNDAPIWEVLDKSTDAAAEFERGDFVDFCDKFIIELNLPLASTDLLAPGPLENSVIKLLKESVGIGQYPNLGRQSEDVAALAVSLANLARTQEATLYPEDIAKSLEIRTDFGRVSQAFPLDKNHFYNRPAFRQKLKDEISNDGFHILTAPPGAGKSWDLTCLAEELANDFIVARHYCYLEPGDELIERRVTTDVFFANIIAELHEVAPEISHGLNRLAADMDTLESALEKATSLGREVVVIVDGLDHISRVRSSSNTLSDDETDIIERLSSMSLPQGVKIIVGSQPGEHLKPIVSRRENDVFIYNLPSWSSAEAKALAKIHGVKQAIKSIGIEADEKVDEILSTISDKSDGNPLYVRYLCKGLISEIKNGISDTPLDWLQLSPSIDGDIAVYYQYLYKKISTQTQIIADLFSVIDFSVSEAELTEIVPLMSFYVPQALSALSPVLTDISGQGGVRIFHESFRRFMLDELERKGHNLNSVLTPVITWLEQQGFYRSSKSYRFLLPALRRAQKHEELYKLVSHSFVAESVSNGHPISAIQSNIAIAADIAGRECNWPIIVRCAELRRALATCFDEGHSWGDFWASYGELFGSESLAERLLFDGKPTLAREDGLMACLLVDDSGGVAPWNEYLYLENSPGESTYGEEFDTNKQLTEEEVINLAIIQGRITLGGAWPMLRRFYEYLLDTIDAPRLCFIRNVSKRFAKNGYENTMLKLARRFDTECQVISIALRLGVADEHKLNGNANLAMEVAVEANTIITSSPILAVMCMEFGAKPVIDSGNIPTLETFDIGLDSHWPEAHNIDSWQATLRILTFNSSGIGIIANESNRLNGIGWYKCWLRYVIELTIAESAKRSNTPYDICSIFSLLNEDVRPFAGNPRACDLYKIHGLIKESLARGLTLIETEDEWRNVLEIIQNVSTSTATRFDQEDGGPISVGTVIDLLLPYADSESASEIICSTIAEQINYLNCRGSYYSIHASYSMQRALMEFKTGHREKAFESWSEVGIYLTGYGWRKDITLFDVIETIPVLINVSTSLALDALEYIQPYVGAVLRHTDGRSTKHAPNAWFDALLEVNPVNALVILARTIAEEDGIESWPTINALKSVATHLQGKVHPVLINALWETIPFKVEYDNEGEEVAKERLEPIESLNSVMPQLVSERLVKLSAEASNDATSYKESAVKVIESTAAKYNLLIDFNIKSSAGRYQQGSNSNPKKLVSGCELIFDYPLFPQNPTSIDLIKGLRKVAETVTYKEKLALQKLSIYLSYKLDEMFHSEDHAGAKRILYFYAREVSILSTDAHPIVYLAECLENVELYSLATIAYALAYTQSRGGGGWYSFGGESHKEILNKGLALDKALAEKTVSEEVSYRLRNTDYGAGISKNLIFRISEWGDHQVAADAWKEAFEVISKRLPLTSENTWFAKFDKSDLVNWELDEGVVLLLLARLSEPRVSRKLSALDGLIKAITYTPESIARPLSWWLSRDTKTTDLLLVLYLLVRSEKAPYDVTNQSKDVLIGYANSQIFGASVLASTLLKRANIDFTYNTNIHPTDVSNLPPCKAEDAKDIFNYDLSSSLEWLCSCDKSLAERMWRQFSYLENEEINTERTHERLKLSLGREGKGYPPVEIVFWQYELFFSVLNDQMLSLRCELESSDELLFAEGILPDVRMHLAIYNSRVPRPNWPTPNNLKPDSLELKVVTGDSRYEGWLQLGCIEEQYVNEKHSFSRPQQLLTLFSGAAVAPEGSYLREGHFPFLPLDNSLWWCEGDIVIHSRPTNIWTQLLGIHKYKDWLGSQLLLVPPPELLMILDIVAPDFGEKLEWKDQLGEPILACRHWWIRGKQSDVESVQIKGSDIIVRPDVIEKLEHMFESQIRLVSTVKKSEV
ncbi:MAG: hypothetical protein SPiBPW_14350 [Shewanella algae]